MELRHKKGNTYKRRKGEKKVWKFSPQKKTGHNTGPTQQSYYCGSGWLKEWNNKKDMAKGIRKGQDKKKKNTSEKKVDTIEDPQTNHTINEKWN